MLNATAFHSPCRIVGMGGVWQSIVLCAFCGACTFLTGLSLSAIATNGAMKVF
jgi:potassium/chloride transporter 4/5/6